MKISCLHCEKPIIGACQVTINGTFHTNCVEPYAQKLAGREHPCPKCKATGVIESETETEQGYVTEYANMTGGTPSCAWADCRGCWMCRSGKRQVLMQVPKKVKCDLCKGHGYTEKQAKPRIIRVQKGWIL